MKRIQLVESLRVDTFSRMSLTDVEQIALELPEIDRGRLAVVLLENVAPDCLQHANDEFERREHDLNEGSVNEIGFEELKKRADTER